MNELNNPQKNLQPDFLEKEELDLYSVSKPVSEIKKNESGNTSFKFRQKIPRKNTFDIDILKSKTSFAKKFFVFSLAVLILAGFYTAYRFIFSESKEGFVSRHISMSINSPNFTRGGEEIPLSLTVSNRNKILLKNVKAFVEYPKGSFAVNYEDFERQTIELGDIPSGSEASKNFNAVLYGEQGEIKNIKINLEYNIPDSNFTYTKNLDTGITISSSPVLVEIDAPKDVAPNQLYTARIRIIQNVKSLPEKTLFKIDYPRDFTVESVSRKIDHGVSTWVLNTKEEGDFDEISVTGRFASQEGEDRSFRFILGTASDENNSNIEISYISKTHIVTLTKPLLNAYILLGTENSKIISVDPNNYVQGVLVYRNISNNRILDPIFRINISGVALDESSILPIDGFYNSNEKQIIWNKDTNPELLTIPPNKEGRLSFTFRVLPSTIEGIRSISNPSVKLALSLSGIRDDGTLSFQNLENIETASVRVNTEAFLDVSVVNAKGALPPKVGEDTTYQIKFNISNSHNEITAGRLIAKLPFYVNWVGKVTSPEKVVYNKDTREVIWNVGNITAGNDLDLFERSAEIQVSIKPSISQVDTTPELLQSISFRGTDLFSNKEINLSHININTRLENNSSRDAIVTP